MTSTHADVLVVGAGPIGLACAISAKRHGRDPLVIDAGPLGNSIVGYPIGMTFFTSPDRLEIGGHPLVCAGQKPTREEALKYYRGVARAEGLPVRPYTRLVGAAPDGTGIAVDVLARHGADETQEQIGCRTLVLATGYFDHVNRLNVPGEDLPHVSHYFDEPHRSSGLDVVVIGGKNSAIEAALELFRAGARVTLVYRRATFKPTVKYWLRPDIDNRISAGEIRARLGAEVVCIDERSITVRSAEGATEALPADRIFALIGFQPNFDLFRSLGIALEPETLRPALNPLTLETNIPGIYMAGSITSGRAVSEVFIENGRFDGEKIFGAG